MLAIVWALVRVYGTCAALVDWARYKVVQRRAKQAWRRWTAQDEDDEIQASRRFGGEDG